MNYSEIIKLLDAGYTREEIMSMQEGADPEADENSENENASEADENSENENVDSLNNAIKEMKTMFSDFTKEIVAMNIMNSRQDPDQENAVDDIIANIISPKSMKKGD